MFCSLTASMHDFHLLLNGAVYTSIYSGAANVGRPNMNSRTFITSLYKSDVLTVTNNVNCSRCYISFTALKLGNISSTNSEFMVGQSQMFNDSDNPAQFDVIIENKGNHYNPNTFTYTAPASGLYVILVSTACQPRMNSRHFITINDVQDVMAGAECQTYDSTLSAGNVLVTSLTAGDMVHVEIRLKPETGGYSDGTLQSAFGGFLYEPSWGVPVAWSVSREVKWPSLIESNSPVNSKRLSKNKSKNKILMLT